jgi:3-hydroxybutyryl-CoA dehydrogenase
VFLQLKDLKRRKDHMQADEIKRICNLGTGAMGYGTALAFAAAGYSVKMFGRSDASIDRGFKSIKAALATLCENGLIGEREISAVIDRIRGVTTLEEAALDTDFVIESVAEDLTVKQEVYARMERLCPPHAIFATDTSGLSPTAIAQTIIRKDKFVVAHFWNPPHLLPLVEVVPGEHTNRETIEITVNLMKLIGKKPITLEREAPGFIGNRLQFALLREAMYIVEKGIASKEAVDAAVRYSLGRRLGVTGPLESADMGGLDVFYNISRYLMSDLCDTHGVSPVISEPFEKGNFGAKTGSGIYKWTPEALADLRKKREKELISWLKKDREKDG